jgi:hypothetical protein
LQSYLKSKKTKEYIEILNRLINNNVTQKDDINQKTIKLKFTRRGYTKDRAWLNGTWLYKDLAIDFFRFLDTEFAVKCDQLIKNIITQSTILHIEREDTKLLFRPLTDVIRDIWIPAQRTENAKKWAYKLIVDLANQIALGKTAKQYKDEHNIEIEQGKSIRDYMSEDELKAIKEVERDIHGYIKYANITDFEELKNRLSKRS